MANFTRQEIIDAHNALKHLISYDLSDTYTEAEVEEVHEREQLIRKFLPPIPRPTMAEVEWDDDKHFLAEANHPTWGRSAMLGLDKDGWIEVISWDEDGPAIHSAIPYYLVPTGKRYTLTEVQE